MARYGSLLTAAQPSCIPTVAALSWFSVNAIATSCRISQLTSTPWKRWCLVGELASGPGLIHSELLLGHRVQSFSRPLPEPVDCAALVEITRPISACRHTSSQLCASWCKKYKATTIMQPLARTHTHTRPVFLQYSSIHSSTGGSYGELGNLCEIKLSCQVQHLNWS